MQDCAKLTGDTGAAAPTAGDAFFQRVLRALNTVGHPTLYNPAMRRTLENFTLLVAISLATGCWAGCQSGEPDRSELRSRSPFERARAAVRVAESGDSTAVHELVDLLQDDDAGVRLYTIEALRRLCGEDFGYRYQAPAPQREGATQAWRAALRDGKVKLQRSRSSIPPQAADRGK
ncbi:MAG: hypothetical protein JNG88_11770 [Phycisphaerales bacterium]|nr:hypothetical protein [Phycisphaerales bacterium]